MGRGGSGFSLGVIDPEHTQGMAWRGVDGES